MASQQNIVASQAQTPLLQPVANRGWGKLGLLMLIVTLLFTGGVGYLIVTSDKQEENETEEFLLESNGAFDASPMNVDAIGMNPVENDIGNPVDSLPQTEGKEVAQTGLIRENGEIDRPAELISISIETEPSGAAVIRSRDNIRIGSTPYRYEVEASNSRLVFLLEKKGYKRAKVEFPGDRDGIRQVMLLPGKESFRQPASQEIASSDDNKKVTKSKKASKQHTAKKRREITVKKKNPKPVKKDKKQIQRETSKNKPVRKKKRGKIDNRMAPITFD